MSAARRRNAAKDADTNLLEDLDQRRRDLEVEIATRETAEARLRETLDRRKRQFDVVGIVAQSDALVAGDVPALARQITELAARAAGCERANIWLFNEDESELRCLDLYEATPGRHSAEVVLHAHEFSAEFATLIKDRYVDADDAATDPRTAGFVPGYVKPLGITAMLDVLIGASGRHFGLLCFEHVGKQHHWEPDEIAFAGQLADKIAFAIGIHARRQAEESVRANEAALAAAQSIAHVGSWEYDPATDCLTWSEETYRIFGADSAAYRPSYATLFLRVHPDDRVALEAEYRDHVARHRPCNIEHRIVRDDGSVRWVHERGETFYDADGRPTRSVGTVQDITERKKFEETLLRERDFSAALVDGLPGIFFVLDAKARVVRHNANLAGVTGRRVEELRGLSAFTDIVAADHDMVRRRMMDVFESGHAEAEIGLRHAVDGTVRQFFVTAHRIDLDGKPGILGMGIDVTEARKAERLLRESEERFKGLVENTVDWVWEMDPEFRFTYASPRSEQLFGYRPEEIVGRSAFDFMTPEDAARARAETAGLFAQRRPMLNVETTFLHKAGHVVIIETNATPYSDADGRYRGYRGIDRDITERKAAELALAESRQILEVIFNSVSVRLFWKDKDLVFLGCNAAFARDAGFADPKDVVGKSDFQMVWSEQAEAYRADDREVVDTGRSKLLIEEAQTTADGKAVTLLTNKIPLRRPNGEIYGVVGTYMDVTERKRIEDAVRESEEKFRTVFSTVSEGILLCDPAAGTFVDANQSACAMFGYARDAMIGMPIEAISAGASPYAQTDAMRLIEAASAAGPQAFEWHCKARDGRMFWADVSIRVTAFGQKTLLLATLRDITERKQAAAQILQMARYDALTGLANRRVFAEAVQQAIARAQRGAKGFAVLYLDLDHFKDVNDTLGHPVGDLLLKAVAERLKGCVRETDTVARFGGDEFAVLAVDIGEPTDAGVLGDKILKALSRPYDISGNEIRSGTSVGISVYGPDLPQAETLLAHADVALYRAKSEGRGTYRFFTDSMDAEVRKRVKLDADLRTALDTNQLFLVYQPQVEAASGRIVGVEALVRWRHPERGIVGPDEFIGAAEKNGLIVPLGRWVLHTACRQAKAWREAGAPPVTVGVNLSALQFKTPLELEKDIATALAENAVPPHLLELELTESVLMKASREHNDVLLRLRKLGLRLAIDDFGTGFSSLDYLRRFPVDRIKIAQVFIIDLVTAAGDAAIVKAAIGLARELGINVIAEGVETEAQLRLLQAWGCREVQGYYFSKPLEADAVLLLLQSGRMAAAGRTRIGSVA
jgi:diguanylate cyclase (GGDEF)-like protein/PAS domain S-box-containing protein